MRRRKKKEKATFNKEGEKEKSNGAVIPFLKIVHRRVQTGLLEGLRLLPKGFHFVQCQVGKGASLFARAGFDM